MWITIVQTDSFSWIAAGRTKKASRQAWSEGFKRHVEGIYSDAADDWIELSYEGSPIDWYGARSYEIKIGDCLRDGEPV